MQQPNQKEPESVQVIGSPDLKGAPTTAGQASDQAMKIKGGDQTGPTSIQKQSSSISQRPSRKAKTKEAVLKHLNRDVELLNDDNKDKKSSVKKEKHNISGPSNSTTTGKRSCTRSGGMASVSKSSVQKATLMERSVQQLVPSSIVASGQSSNENQPIAPFVSSLTQKKLTPPSKFKEIDESQKNINDMATKNLRSRKQDSEKKGNNAELTGQTFRSIVKQTPKKTETPVKPTKRDEPKEEVDIDQPTQLEAKKSDNENISDLSGTLEEFSEESRSQDSDVNAEEDASEAEEVPSKKKGGRKKMTEAETRALRIKQGKSGIQAASRRIIKQGKDACQRKLWNQKEDDAIVSLVDKYGTKRWTFIAQMLKEEYKIYGRTGKQCRERWHNHLDPNIKKSPINQEEEITIFDAHKIYGNKWADIAKLLQGRSDNCIKNYYYSTLRKHIRRINKSLKQCQVAKHLNLKVKTLTADILFPLVKEGKFQYTMIINIDPKKFEDLEHTMRMIFNHEDGQQVTQRGIIAAAQNRLKIEKTLNEMRMRELEEEEELKEAAVVKQAQKKEHNSPCSDEKMLGKRAVAKYKYEQSQKKQKVDEFKSQSNPEDNSSYSIIDEDQNRSNQVKLLKAQGHFADLEKQRTPRDNNTNTDKNVKNDPNLQIQNLSFPKGLQMKPPISKKQNPQPPSKLQDKMFFNQGISLEAQPSSQTQQLPNSNSQHVFKSSLTGNPLSVTGEVTKNKFRNGSNDSANSKIEQLHDEDKMYRDKKNKKKKNKKDKKSGDKYKKKLLYPFYPISQGFDENVQQFEQMQNQLYSQNPKQASDMLGLTNQKSSGSKIYPGFYDHMYHNQKQKVSGKDMPMMPPGFGSMIPHTCFGQGGHQSFVPYPMYMYHPAQAHSMFMPYPPQQSMEMMMNNPLFKQMKKNYQDSKSANDGKEKSKQGSSDKKKEDNDEVDKKSKTDKDKSEEQQYMDQLMSQFNQLPPHVQAFYQKTGAYPPFQFPPANFFPPFQMHGQLPTQGNQRDKHNTANYHKHFSMPITPSGLQSQVFGGEKQFQQANPQNPGVSQELQKQFFKRSHASFDTNNDEQDGAQSNQAQKTDEAQGQSVSQIRSQHHLPQYNSNITVMINQYGPTINQQVPDGENQPQNAKQKVSTERNAEEAILNLLPSKQGSLKVPDQHNMRPAGTASASFKSQFKPQSIGTLNFQQKFHQHVLNSKGVTPSNQNAAPISASNLLLSQAFMQHQQFGGNPESQNHWIPGRDMKSLKERLAAGTPRLFIGPNNTWNSQGKMPTSTTAATAAAFLQQHGGGFVEPLKSTRNVNLHSKETFAGQLGSKLNTKTNAQLTAQKSNAKQIITPKVSTVGNDPDAYRKNLEKMFMNVNKQQESNHNECILSANGGAFTHKKQSASRENSYQKNSKPSVESCKQGTGRKTELQSQVSKTKQEVKHFERDSLGLFLVDHRHENNQLALNNEPLGSIYTNHDNLNITNNSSAAKNMFEINPDIEPPTPNLQLKQEDSIMDDKEDDRMETEQ